MQVFQTASITYVAASSATISMAGTEPEVAPQHIDNKHFDSNAPFSRRARNRTSVVTATKKNVCCVTASKKSAENSTATGAPTHLRARSCCPATERDAD